MKLRMVRVLGAGWLAAGMAWASAQTSTAASPQPIVHTAAASRPASGHGGHGHKRRTELGTSAAVHPDGRLWVAGKASGTDGDFVVLRHSRDGGKTWSDAMPVHADPERVSADGENRPKLAFGPQGEFYVTWTRPTSERYTGDIRFVRSLDGGRTWSKPINVHRDAQRITHRFESLWVDGKGTVWVLWIDKRDQEAAKRAGRAYVGAAIYYAFSQDRGVRWTGDLKLADASCECCRIAVASHPDGAPVAFWRHVFPGSERDHALAKLVGEASPEIERATFDRWKIQACPHHGPSLAITSDGTRHAVWFNQVEGEGRVFYGRLARGSVEGQMALPDSNAEHADLAAAGSAVWVAWKSFDGARTVARSLISADGGRSWRDGPSLVTEGASDQVRLALQGERAWLIWNTEREGVRAEALQ